MDINALVQQLAGGGNAPAQQAVDDHLGSMPAEDVRDHMQTAATNAAQNGNPDVARELEGLIAQHGLDAEELKAAAIDYVKSHPQILTQFAPSFAQGLLNRVL